MGLEGSREGVAKSEDGLGRDGLGLVCGTMAHEPEVKVRLLVGEGTRIEGLENGKECSLKRTWRAM